MPLHTPITIDGIMLLLNTFGINTRYTRIKFGYMSYDIHGDMDRSSFEPIGLQWYRKRTHKMSI